MRDRYERKHRVSLRTAIARGNHAAVPLPGVSEMSDFPRRHQMLQWIPAELAIFDAIQAVELVGADVRLTEAVILLGKAQALVADFVDGVPLGEGYPRPAAAIPPE